LGDGFGGTVFPLSMRLTSRQPTRALHPIGQPHFVFFCSSPGCFFVGHCFMSLEIHSLAKFLDGPD
jgi:hypothetical protein